MKFFLYLSFSIFCFSCSSSKEASKNKAIVEDKAIDFGFNPDHPNSLQFNWMLNNYSEEFTAIESDWDQWINEELVEERFSFHSSKSHLILYLVFCSHQKDCIAVCEANFSDPNYKTDWGVNGAVAFVVMGENQSDIDDLLGYLAGEE